MVEPSFLNSEPFRLRLLLNALTSPHSFLGGNVTLYSVHRRRAEYALALLALSLHDDTVITLADAIIVGTEHTDGARGKDFMGYTSGPHLYGALNRSLAHLAAEGSSGISTAVAFEATWRRSGPRSRSFALPMAERDWAMAPGTMTHWGLSLDASSQGT